MSADILEIDQPVVSVSIVSHGHGEMVGRLVGQLLACHQVLEVIVTLNIPELITFPGSDKLKILNNNHPKGFGENHNSAFRICDGQYFCPVNPDVELLNNPFPELLSLIKKSGAGLVAPKVMCSLGYQEDSWRRFPTVVGIAKKVLGLSDGGIYTSVESAEPFSPDWVAGMFMLFRRQEYSGLGGFDESFFLYYEDVDICERLRSAGGSLVVHPLVQVVHYAQRASRRDFKHLRFHMVSVFRYFMKHKRRLLL